MREFKTQTNNLEETHLLGEKLGRNASENMVFLLDGDLGAGKTTLIRTAMGIMNPDEGECQLLGTSDRRSARVHAGYVSQIFGLYIDMKNSIKMDVTQAELNLRSARTRLEVATRQVTESEEDYRIAVKRYEGNVGTNLDMPALVIFGMISLPKSCRSPFVGHCRFFRVLKHILWYNTQV